MKLLKTYYNSSYSGIKSLTTRNIWNISSTSSTLRSTANYRTYLSKVDFVYKHNLSHVNSTITVKRIHNIKLTFRKDISNCKLGASSASSALSVLCISGVIE